MRKLYSTIALSAILFACVQAQGPVLAWNHTGPVTMFRVRIDGQAPIPIGVPDRDSTGRYMWPLPALSAAAHNFIVEACNVLNVCEPSVRLSVPAPTSKTIAPTNVRWEQTATGRIGTGVPTGTFVGSGGAPPVPLVANTPSPTAGASGVSITPALTFQVPELNAATSTTYALRLDTVNPPSNTNAIGTATTFNPPALNYATTYYWRVDGTNSAGTTTGNVWSFTTAAAPGPGSPPSNLAPIFPTSGATGTTVQPNLQCSADSADSYVVKFGTNNPPSNITSGTSLGGTCSYPVIATLAYATTYYWQILATNANGTTTGAVWSFTTRADPGPTSFCTRPCTRLFSTAEMSTFIARKNANTAEYAAAKAFVDSTGCGGTGCYPAHILYTATLTSALGTGGAGTTFTVDDGSPFPTAQHQLRIDLEVVTVTRSGNTFTIVSRGDGYVGISDITTHAIGANIWHHITAGTDVGYAGPMVALLVNMGVPGYSSIAGRWYLNALATMFAGQGLMFGGNWIRHLGYYTAVMHDLNYANLTANEKTIYAAFFRNVIQHFIDDPKMSGTGRATLQQAAFGNNVANGILRSTLALAATSYGDNIDAQIQWDTEAAKVTTYGKPGMLGGATSAGLLIEGVEYMQTSWVQMMDVIQVIAAATGDATYQTDIEPWAERMLQSILYLTLPGTAYDTTTTTTTTTAGSPTVTLASASTFAVGQDVYQTLPVYGSSTYGTLTVDASVNTDVTPGTYPVSSSDVGMFLYVQGSVWTEGHYRIESIVGGTKWRLSGVVAPVGSTGGTWQTRGIHYSTIAAISGTTVTLRDNVPTSQTGQTFGHRTTMYAFGDIEQDHRNYMDQDFFNGEPTLAVAMAQALVNGTNPTLATHAQYWLDHAAPPVDANLRWRWYVKKTPSIAAVDYTATLANNYTTADPDAFGVVVGKSGWAATASYAVLISGNEVFDHGTSYFGSYGYRRKGVYLTRHLEGYGPTGVKGPPHFNECGTGCYVSESPYAGARYHNTIQMNGHSALVPWVGSNEDTGPSQLTRSSVSSTYAYGRVDASQVYNGTWWTGFGWPNNNAQTFVRDWFYLNNDLIVVHDRTAYSAATVSPTRWNFNTPGDPSFVGQRMTMTTAGQTLVQDILLPAAATITKVNLFSDANEDELLEGYRTEVVSGVSASTEYGFNVLQGGDSGFSPVTVTTLTTTNANVAQIGTAWVVGTAKGASPTLNITYVVSGTPRNLISGMAVSTAYHVTRSVDTITIAAATGSGDTTSSAAGVLDFTL